MFPHNSSSHEISTETNAFVQNSKGDVVVLEGSSLSGAREGERPEHARYCDIEFINSSMMAAPISHPKATAANDFLTVLPRQSGELSFAGVGEACQSVAKETTKNPTNHLLTYDNNNKVNNHNNAEHNHHKYRKQKTPGSLFGQQQLGSSADTSKSTSKPLSDNKDSFSDISVRVLKVSVRLVVKEEEEEKKEEKARRDRTRKKKKKERKIVKKRGSRKKVDARKESERKRGETRRPAGVPSLVRIPKSDRPQRQTRLAKIVDNYSLLGSRLDHGENNKFKANISLVSNNYYYRYNNNSKSVILLSSTSHGDNYLLAEFGLAGVDAVIPVIIVVHQYDDVRVIIEIKVVVKDDYKDATMITNVRAISDTMYDDDEEEEEERFSTLSSMLKNHEKETQKRRINVVKTTTTTTTRTKPSSSRYEGHRETKRIQSTITSMIDERRRSNGNGSSYVESTITSLIINTANHADSSITLIVCKNEITDHTLQSFLDNLTKVRAVSRITTKNNYLIDRVTVITLKQRICVPLLIMINNNDENNNGIGNNDDDFNDYCNDDVVVDNEELDAPDDDECFKDGTILDDYRTIDHDDYKNVKIVITKNNDDVIEDIVDVAVCYKTSYLTTTNISVLGSQNDDDDDYGIELTEATMFNVGALSFQDNVYCNKPLNDNFKIFNDCQVSKSVVVRSSSSYDMSKSRIDDLDDRVVVTSNRNYDDHNEIITSKSVNDDFVDHDDHDYSRELKNHEDTDNVNCCSDDIVDIPTPNTCEPTMTLNCKSATVTSQTNDVPETRELSASINHDLNVKCINDLRTCVRRDQQDDVTTSRVSTRDNSGIDYFGNNDFSMRKITSNLMLRIRETIEAYKKTRENNEKDHDAVRRELKNFLDFVFGGSVNEHHEQDPIVGYKGRWGIPSMMRLCGGGESSLNSGGGANWGSAPATTPNNNNANQSGWGGTPGNPTGNAGPPSNWGGNNVNRPVTGNPNGNQNQGPPGNQTNPGNVNKVNNPNQPGNPQSGQPTSQSSNPSQGNQNSAGQWSQGKSNNPVGPGGPNPTSQNNNGNNVPQQPSGSNPNNNQVNNPVQGVVATTGSSVATNPSTKAQLEQLNTMREALFSQDGWGCQHVNQDTNWDVPTSPEPTLTKDGAPIWKPPVNNGTDLWEANLRNGGQPPPPQQAKTPWGHTPSTNIGGTWGEDDDAADTSNMWTGAPGPSQPNTPQWPGGSGSQAGPSWGDPRIDPRDPRDLRSVDPREMRDPRDHRMTLDPRDHMRVMDPMAGRDPRMNDMRGDPRGISGRLNGANADAMWAQPGPSHHQMSHQHPSTTGGGGGGGGGGGSGGGGGGGGPPTKMINPSSMNQWAAPPPKDMIPGKPSGWEEPSPPTQRRNVPNYDDGTSLWGNPAANQRAMPGSKVSHWKDLPTPNLGRGGMQCPPGMPQNRMPGQPGMKPDVGIGGGGGGGGPMWGHPGGPGGGGGGGGGRNGSWADGPHDNSSWDEPKAPAAWNEPQLNQATWGGPGGHKSKAMGGPGAGSWADTDMDQTPTWAHPAKPALTKEMIWNSREGHFLCDLGYKKEEVEAALRKRDMNRDEAQELLNQLRSPDQWRRHDAQSAYDPTSPASIAAAHPIRFNHVAQHMSFPPGAGVGPSGSGTGNVSGSVASASLLKLQQQQQQQAAVQLQQQQPSVNPPQPPFNQASRTLQNPPSTQQLRMLVQQIQLAVQEGYLNQQILNQPLAPPTLLLLNQLLQQIKVLQQLIQQHSVQNSLKGNGQTVLQISVQITKTKQQITNLQNQIAVQQATYMKQQQHQQQQQQHPSAQSQASDYYKTSSVHDPMSALQNSFSDLGMNKEPPVSQQQSRLNQWKLPSLDKDGDLAANEFSRAPGTTSKPLQTQVGLGHTHSSPNMNPLLGQGDGAWSSRLGDSGGWPDAGNNDATDGKDWQPGGTAFTDLVPEFEPGKPWKMKNIEDDPSITPGSVVRSLSLAAIKDPDAIFSSSNKTSPPPQSVNPDTSIPSLSNSTWSFNPPSTTQSAFAGAKNTWTDPAPPTYSELWGVPMRARGPPPGLGSKAAGWTSGTWLLLKNLTPQIDGSTLKTLCMQHGPVLDFRLYLNHGIALTKYSTRDEATKAQGALNNCVLGNTTIFAESPVDNEAHTLLHTLSHGSGGQQQSAGSGNTGWTMRPTKKAGPPPDTWSGSSSQLWGAPPSSNSLWSNAGIDSGDPQRTTPSSLNLYLPGDLLGGESM